MTVKHRGEEFDEMARRRCGLQKRDDLGDMRFQILLGVLFDELM